MSFVYFTLGGDYNAGLSSTVYTAVTLVADGNYDVREFPEFSVGYAAFNGNTGSGPIFFQSSSSTSSDLNYSNAGYFFDFSDNINTVSIVGGIFGDIIRTGTGNDALNGGGGDDTLVGFGGDDRYYIDSAADRVVEASGGGTDTVFAAASYTLAAGQEIEVLSVISVEAIDEIDLTGNNLANTLIGNAGANVLSGGGGDDQLTGLAGEDFLIGGGGADRLDGGADADVMRGGEGDDTYYVDNAGDLVFESSGSGTDTIVSRGSYVLQAGLSVEALRFTTATGTAALDLTGNEFAQTVTGNAGANRLDGGGGADTMHGLSGDDTYYVDDLGDLVFEGAGRGNDAVAARASYALAAGQSIETLRFTTVTGTANMDLTGNDLAQVVTGNAGDNVLDGKGGLDTLRGYGGADIFSFSTARGSGNVDHIVDFSAAADTIRLDDAIYTGLAIGTLAATAFKNIGDPAAVVDGDDRILYNDDTGEIFYDSNGSVNGGRTLFAILDNTPQNLTHEDFVIA